MKRKLFWILAISGLVLAAAGLFFVLHYTNPTTAGPLGVLIVFATAFLFSFVVIYTTISIIEAIYCSIASSRKKDNERNTRTNVINKRTAYISIALSFAPLFLLSLNSIGQLQIRDIFLILLIEVVAIFYIVKRV